MPTFAGPGIQRTRSHHGILSGQGLSPSLALPVSSSTQPKGKAVALPPRTGGPWVFSLSSCLSLSPSLAVSLSLSLADVLMTKSPAALDFGRVASLHPLPESTDEQLSWLKQIKWWKSDCAPSTPTLKAQTIAFRGPWLKEPGQHAVLRHLRGLFDFMRLVCSAAHLRCKF